MHYSRCICEPFFSNLLLYGHRRFLKPKSRRPSFIVRPGFLRWWRKRRRLRQNFRQDLHVTDAGGYAKPAALRRTLNAYHGCLAADPTPLARGELGRKHQHHFELTSLQHGGTGVKKYPAGAQVSSETGGLPITAGRAHGYRHARRYTRPGTPLGWKPGHGTARVPHPVGGKASYAGTIRRFPGLRESTIQRFLLRDENSQGGKALI